MRSRPRGALRRARDSCHVGRGTSRPRRCVPSPQRGEGQDEGVRESEKNLKHPNPLTPTLSPLGRGSSLCGLLRTCMASAFVLAAHFGARVFSARDRKQSARQQKTVTSNAKPALDKRKPGVGPAFRSSVFPVSPDQSNKLKEAERRQTQGNHRRILRCGARPFGARTLDGVPPRLSPEGIIPSQRLSFRPGFLLGWTAPYGIGVPE